MLGCYHGFQGHKTHGQCSRYYCPHQSLFCAQTHKNTSSLFLCVNQHLLFLFLIWILRMDFITKLTVAALWFWPCAFIQCLRILIVPRWQSVKFISVIWCQNRPLCEMGSARKHFNYFIAGDWQAQLLNLPKTKKISQFF